MLLPFVLRYHVINSYRAHHSGVDFSMTISLIHVHLRPAYIVVIDSDNGKDTINTDT